MKVKELIEELKKHNPDDMVVVSGYEGGYNEVNRATIIKGVLNYYDKNKWYYGNHEDIENIYNVDKDELKTTTLVFIGG